MDANGSSLARVQRDSAKNATQAPSSVNSKHSTGGPSLTVVTGVLTSLSSPSTDSAKSVIGREDR